MSELGAIGEETVLDPRVRRHIEVLRLKPGTTIELFDGSGEHVSAEWLGDRARVLKRGRHDDVGPRVTLIQALPKGGTSDDIVRMTTELGVAAIHFAFSERSVPKLDEARAVKRLGRWERLAHEAARQSERASIPELVGPAPLAEVIARAPDDAAKLVCWARDDSKGLAPAAQSARWVAVGPEGGFTDAELHSFEQAGYRTLSLGPNVLRVDTAAIAAVAHLVRA